MPEIHQIEPGAYYPVIPMPTQFNPEPKALGWRYVSAAPPPHWEELERAREVEPRPAFFL